jgi:hypothetical protein
MRSGILGPSDYWGMARTTPGHAGYYALTLYQAQAKVKKPQDQAQAKVEKPQAEAEIARQNARDAAEMQRQRLL